MPIGKNFFQQKNTKNPKNRKIILKTGIKSRKKSKMLEINYLFCNLCFGIKFALYISIKNENFKKGGKMFRFMQAK